MRHKFFTVPTFRDLGILVMMMSAFMISACGGGSGSSSSSNGSVSALSLPDRIELTNVEDQSGASQAALVAGLYQASAFDGAGTDYSSAEKHSWVDDTEALDMVNDILGVVKDTAYTSFINAGPYKALVRKVGDSEQSQSGSNTTSTTTEQLMEIIVDVTRASNNDPMYVKIWVEEEDGPGEQPMLIRGYFTVTQGVSDSYPFGVMTAHFKGTALDSAGNEGDDMFNMAMSVNADGGNVVIETVEDSEEGEEFGFHTRVQVVANADVTEGNAYVWEEETHPDGMGDPVTEEGTDLIAFTADYFKVEDDEGTVAYYSKQNLKHRVFNYKLFDAVSGDKVSLSSGFPIKTEDGKQGYIGYYGLWTSHGATVQNGDTVYDMDDNAYQVFRAGGKLTKHTKDEMDLSAIDGVELTKWVCAENSCQDTIVAWDSASETFITLGYRNQETGQVVYYSPTDAGYHDPVEFNEWDGAWCEPLRAYLRLGSLYRDEFGTPTTPTDASTFSYHTEQTIDPSTAQDLTLYTWEFAMNTPIGQTEVDSYDTDRNTYWGGSPTQKTFNFDADTMMLTDGTNDVTLDSDLNIPDGSDLQWGYHIGGLTTDNTLQSWESHNATTYYTWNTGGDPWNQFVTVRYDDGAGALVGFDPPVSFSYTHATANDVNGESQYNGKTFRMEFDGFSVHIPWEYDPDTDEWEPIINIKDGVVMGPSNEYVIKAVEESLVMEAISDPGAAFPSNAVGEPSLTYDATKTALVGARPATAVLKVIKGEVQ